VGLRGARLSWVRTLLVGCRAATWVAVAGRGAAEGGDAGASAGDRPGREVLDADVAGVALARELGLPLPGGFDGPGFAGAPPASRVVASHRWHRCGPQACSGPRTGSRRLLKGMPPRRKLSRWAGLRTGGFPMGLGTPCSSKEGNGVGSVTATVTVPMSSNVIGRRSAHWERRSQLISGAP